MLKRIAVLFAGLALVVTGLTAPALAHPSAKPTAPHATALDKPTTGFTAPKGAPTGGTTVQSFTACGSPSVCYSYVGGMQTVSNVGVAGTIDIGCPFVYSADYHSLGEVTSIRDDGSGVRQIVELGWRKTSAGTCQLFVYAWKNGVGLGYNGGGYVDYAPNTTVYAGMTVTAGQRMSLRITYDAATPSGGAWWMWVDPDGSGPTAGDWIGYYPQSVWSGLSTAFTTANQIQGFFELASSVVESRSDMGDGYQGSGGSGASPAPAVLGSVSYGTATGVYANATLGYYVIPTGSTKWTQNTPSVRTFYGGGPGWDSTGTTIGVTGS